MRFRFSWSVFFAVIVVSLLIFGLKSGPRLIREYSTAWASRPHSSTSTGVQNGLPPIAVYFSPMGGCTEACVNEINAAKESILVQAYSFTSKPIADALIAASHRIKVAVILDKSELRGVGGMAGPLVNAGVISYVDSKHAIAHNKVMIIDEQTIITGSFNFTSSAEKKNAENMLIIRDPSLALIYIKNWTLHQGHSERLYSQ